MEQYRKIRLWVFLVVILSLVQGVDSAVIFSDDFNSGFGKWNLYGSPSPVILSSFGGRSGVFDNKGDSWCESGIVTKDLMSLDKGVVIESDVYLQIMSWSGCWGVADVSVTRDKDPYWDHPYCPGEGYYDGAMISLVGFGDACLTTPAQYRRHAYVSTSILAEDGTSDGNGYAFIADNYINGWHTLKIIIDKDRYVSFYIDNTFVYKTQKKIDPTILQGKRLQLGRRSSGSIGKAYHDSIQVCDLIEYDDLIPLPGYINLPTDPDCDGIYEDLNANGRLDFADVVLYFNQMTWISANEPIAAFDLNGNGRIDFADIVALFNEI